MRVQATEDTFGFATGLLDQLIASRTARAANSRKRSAFDGASTWRPELAFESAKAPRLTPALFARINLRYPDICDRVLALHARGYGMEDIQSRVSMYAGEPIPAAFVKAALADLETEALEWARRPLEPSYPIVIFERMRVRWRDRTGAQNRNCHFAIGFNAHGPKEVLGFWLEKNDERDHWNDALGDLRDRGVDDIIYFAGSGTGASTALAQVFPAALAIPHVGDLVRQSQDLSTCKNRCTIAKALRPVHGAVSQAEAAVHLEEFAASELGGRNPSIVSIWRRHWNDLEAFFAISPEVRCVMTSTFAADGLRRGLKHALARRRHVSSASETTTLMYLVARDARRNWKRPQREWHAAKGQLAMQFPDRFF
jgi:transposase-like protein